MRAKGKAITQLSALSRLFSSSVFREMAKKGRSGLFLGLSRQAGLFDMPVFTVAEIFDSAFDALNTPGDRSEYIYRSTLINKVLIDDRGLEAASVLNEFRTGCRKADLVILDGTATVYEIKSERDSLARLEGQIQNYKRVFAKVNVIASEGHIQGVLNMVPDDVGVMCLSEGNRITTVREAADCPARICPVTVFESLRIDESIAILQAMGIAVPDCPNTQRYSAMRDIFAMLDPVALHKEMVRTLKRTRDLSPLRDLIRLLPKSLHAAALSVPVRRSDHSRLIKAVNTSVGEAMAW